MKMRKEKMLWNLLLGTGVYLLESLRERAGSSFEDLSGRAWDTYDEASRRASRAEDKKQDGKKHQPRQDLEKGLPWSTQK